MFKMKKVIVLFMVLGLVSVANAGVVDVLITSLNGEAITPTKEITISASDVIDFQITFTAPTTEWLFAIGAVMNVTGPASLDFSNFVYATYDPDAEAWTNVDIHAQFDPDFHSLGTNYIVEAAKAKGVKGTAAEIWTVRNLGLHCDGYGDVTLFLTNYAGSPTIVIDTSYNEVPYTFGAGVVIHQLIPEPMTLTLLGLGSLFLARRKK
jgi:hypothetical protein